MLRLQLNTGEVWECAAATGTMVEEAAGVRRYDRDSRDRVVGWELVPWHNISSFSRYRSYGRRSVRAA